MSDSPVWMPFYVDDYLGDTGELSTLEHGAYILLILHYWKHRGLPAADEKRLARIARLSDAEWAGMRDAIAMHFASDWHHNRIDTELAKADHTITKRKAAGMAGASARYGKSSSNRTTKPVATEWQTNAPSPTPSEEDSSLRSLSSARVAENPKPEANGHDPGGIPIALWRGERTPAWFDQVELECREAAGLESEPSPALCDTSPIVTLLDQGYDFSRDILPKLRAAKAAKKHGRTWAYYVPAITEGKAANSSIKPNAQQVVAPQIWITEDDPRWAKAAELWKAAKGKLPPILAGAHGNSGRGWHFPISMVA